MRNLTLIILFCCISLSIAAQDKRYHGDGVDDYLRFVPITAVYAMKVCGVESASSWKRLLVNTASSYVIAAGTTYVLKHAVHERRPDGTDNRAFPSGHSMVAFAGATILHKEYRHVSKWIGVAGYGLAALTAADRVRRNRHKWGDVLVGAGIGVGATELGYWLGDKLTGERSRYRVAVSGDGIQLAIGL